MRCSSNVLNRLDFKCCAYRKYDHGNTVYKANTGLDLSAKLNSIEKRQKVDLSNYVDRG